MSRVNSSRLLASDERKAFLRWSGGWVLMYDVRSMYLREGAMPRAVNDGTAVRSGCTEAPRAGNTVKKRRAGALLPPKEPLVLPLEERI
eukprot:894615-Prymnesium_polylepis.1